MDAGSSFERLIRLVQETGERMVVSLDLHKDPVVLLPLSSYERLIAQSDKTASHIRATEIPLKKEGASVRTSVVLPDSLTSDPVDTWDGEGGEDYDAERIFASAAIGKNVSPLPPSDRLKASVSRASEAYEAMRPDAWRAGSGGQRLPIRPSALGDEERFSLGMG